MAEITRKELNEMSDSLKKAESLADRRERKIKELEDDALLTRIGTPVAAVVGIRATQAVGKVAPEVMYVYGTRVDRVVIGGLGFASMAFIKSTPLSTILTTAAWSYANG